jgi:RES domain-containing protein
MWIWRLSGADYAERFDGGFGIDHDGRWNDRGRAVTYCATGPALCVLEKLAHIEDPNLMPGDTALVRYDVPDDLRIEETSLDGLPGNWRADRRLTRTIGNVWLDAASACLLRVPSVIVPVPDADDRNILVNHRHEDAARIAISRIERFEYDPRLFVFG